MQAPPVHCRSTVLTPAGRADVCLPVDVPVAELVPMLMDLLGAPALPVERPVPWQLTGASGTPLPATATLDELGILDGELLRLGPAAPPPPPPVFDDPVDALAELAGSRAASDRRPLAVIVLLGVVPAAALLLGGVRAGGVSGVHRWSAVALAALAAAASIAWAAHLRRRATAPPGSADDAASAAVVAALCAVPLAAAAGWAAVTGPPGGALLVAAVAAGVAAALAQVAVRTASAALIGGAVAAVLTAAAAGVYVQFGAPTHAVAGLTAAVALSAGPLSSRLVLRLAGLPRPVVPADATELTAGDSGADLLPPAELAARSRLAHTELAGLSGGCAVVAAVSGSFAATGGSPVWSGPALAAAVAAVLLLRARGFADRATARVHVVTGTAVAVALVGSAAPAFGPEGHLAGALVLLGGAAAAVVVAAGGGAADASPVARRGVDVVEFVLTAAALPLALAVAGVFAVVRSL